MSAARWRRLYREYCQAKEDAGGKQLRRSNFQGKPLGEWMHYNDARYSELSVKQLRDLSEAQYSYRDRNLMAWLERYLELCDFQQQQGHCIVGPDHRTLNFWVRAPRQRRAQLPTDQRLMLERLGFSWDPLYEQWMGHYEELRAFMEQHGHCKIPVNEPRYEQLACWVKKQRTKRERMEPRRVLLLDKIGFVWTPYDDEWEANFQKLKAIYAKHGPLATATVDPEYQEVSVWVDVQRSRQRGSGGFNPLTDEQLAKLKSIGFVFYKWEHLWEQAYAELKAFYEEHGHLRLPQLSTRNRELQAWMLHQRQRKASGAMPRKQVILLNQIEFSWGVQTDRWDEQFAALKAFKQEHGHCRVSPQTNPSLNKWCRKQRVLRRANKLTKRQINRLKWLGFNWGRPQKTIKAD
ncbi:helicase associated domain-containing protein [Cerasicoccus maritimus]|uniref:helicase associated domain-containing protein n=1 Tax=Cerasicoccus maritimus TaxID=490089 RepID=UPI002852C0AE|nr:helicase associated domain-containing protein [Cerasicoccus maritimus]